MQALQSNNQPAPSLASNLECTLIVSSCDAYKDLWTPFFSLFRRYWPDCPFKIALITETLTTSLPNVRTIACGSNTNWSSRLMYAAEQIDTPYVILMLEDFFIRSRINTNDVLNYLSYVKCANLEMLRLIKRPGPDSKRRDTNLVGDIKSDASYKVSTQVAIWRSSTLLSLLRDGESIWQFEHFGSQRARKLRGFACVKQDVFTYRHHVVERGKWFPWYAKEFSLMQIGVDLSARPVMTKGESLKWLLQKSLGPIATKLPSSARRFVKPLLLRLNIV